MGLDITAYSHILPGPEDDHFNHHTTECENPEHVALYSNQAFPDHFGWPADGCYRTSNMTETHGFRAGSYTGYSEWRDQLDAFAQHVKKKYNLDQLPFQELTNFSDCEGTIGPGPSIRLFDDFHSFLEDIETWKGITDEETREWFTQKYQDWMRAFELAKEMGAVRFH